MTGLSAPPECLATDYRSSALTKQNTFGSDNLFRHWTKCSTSFQTTFSNLIENRPNWPQANIWTDVGLVYQGKYSSLDLGELVANRNFCEVMKVFGDYMITVVDCILIRIEIGIILLNSNEKQITWRHTKRIKWWFSNKQYLLHRAFCVMAMVHVVLDTSDK